MADDITELVVKIQADIADLKSDMQDAKDTVADSTNDMSKAAKELAKTFAAAFAIEKLKDYCENAVESFADVERQMNVLGAQVTANGGNWDEWKEKVNAFLISEASVYNTTKEKLLPVLNELYLATHDMALSMKLMDDAQRLSLVTRKDAATIAEDLSLAYAGNTRGIAQLGRAMKMSTEDAKDVNLVMAEMEKKLKTVGDVSGDTKSKIGTMSVSWAEDMEHVGQVLSPIVDILHVIEKVIINGVDVALTSAKIIGDIIIGIGLELKNLNDLVLHPFSVKAWKDFGSNVGGILKTTWATAHEEMTDFAKKASDTWVEETKTVKLETDKQISDAFKASAAREAADKDAASESKKAIKGIEETSKNAYKSIDEEAAAEAAHAKAYAKDKLATDKADAEAAKAAWVGAVNDSVKAKQKALADWSKFAKSGSDADKTAAVASEKAFDASIKEVDKKRREALSAGKRYDTEAEEHKKQMAEMELQTADKTLSTLSSLSKSKNKEIAEIAKDAAVAKATINTFESVTQALAAYPPPYSFIMAAATAIAGGIEIANIEGVALAKGGIVNAPTNALIGEGGEPEAVVPLSKAGEMGFGGGGDTHNHTWNFPGVTNRSEAKAAGESAALIFIKTQQKSKTRAGNRNTSF